jgi:4-amino-4-deoxy-L-arabinose transferase-like glycosyltransferase
LNLAGGPPPVDPAGAGSRPIDLRPAAPRDPTRRWLAVELGLLAALAAVIRFWGIGERALWLDEANTVLIAGKGPAGVVDALARDGNPPLFYWLLHVWMKLFGSSEAAVRSLPAVFGILGVLAVYLAARTLFPGRPRIATIAGAIALLSPLHVYYSQECRMYTLSPLLGILAFVSLDRFLESGRARPLVFHAALLAAGLYTHNYFLFLLPVGPAIALLAPGRAGRGRVLLGTLAAAAAALVLYSPWIPVLLGQSRSGVDAWIPGIWRGTPPGAAFLRSVEVMGIGGAFPRYLRQLSTPGLTIPLGPVWPLLRFFGFVLGVGLVGNGFASAWRGRGEREAGIRLGLFFLLPLLLPILTSFLLRPIYLVGRYEMVAFTAFAVLAGTALDALFSAVEPNKRVAGVAAAALWVTGAALCLAAAISAHVPEDEKEAAAWLRSNASPGDVTVFSGLTRAVPEYYLTRWDVRGERLSFPPDVDAHLGWCDEERAVRNAGETMRQAASLADRVLESKPEGGRVFVVVTRSTEEKINSWLRDALTERFGNPSATLGPMTYILVFDPAL